MAKRKKRKQIYFYECNLTGEKFKTTKEVENPEELMSLAAFYDLNPELDDRPEDVKHEIIKKEKVTSAPSTWDELVALSEGRGLDDESSEEDKKEEKKESSVKTK